MESQKFKEKYPKLWEEVDTKLAALTIGADSANENGEAKIATQIEKEYNDLSNDFKRLMLDI